MGGAEFVPLWTAVAAVAASLSALMAAIYTAVTFRLVRLQAEPKVVVYARGDGERQTIVMIRIENIGRDVATDITFKASRPIPCRAYGLSVDDARPAETMTDGPLIDGISVLGPGDSRDITWGQFGGLMKAVGKDPIVIDLAYRHGRRRLQGQSRLEILSFLGTDCSENPASVSAKSLERVAKACEAIVQQLRELESLLQQHGPAV